MGTLIIEPLFLITIYSHFFKVTGFKENNHNLLDRFSFLYTHKAFKQTSKYRQSNEPPDKVYAFCNNDKDEYRFHIGQFKFFMEYMERQGYPSDFFNIKYVEMLKPATIKTEIREGWDFRDRQEEVVDFILKDMNDDFNSRLVTLPTGYGKGMIALSAICKRAYRTAIIVLPQFLNKWSEEIKEKTTASSKNIMTVQGSDYVRGLISLAKSGQYKTDFLLISMKTWVNFIDSYKKDPKFCINEEYGCSPEELLELLGIGTIVIDEIHLHMHAIYKTFCFMNINLTIGLSATYLSADAFIDKMQRTMFPREIRFESVEMEKYIRAYGISYSINPEMMKYIRTTERNQTSYSQNSFERSILKNKNITQKYLEIIKEVLINGFVDDYKPGYRCVIYSRSVAMCDTISRYIQKEFPRFSTAKYTEEDSYDNLLKPDIRCTTMQSGGTGHDIKNLVTTISLDNVSSIVSNLQCLGRLRKPKDATARYFSVFCQNIPKHYDYHLQKKQAFSNKVLSFKDFRSNVSI